MNVALPLDDTTNTDLSVLSGFAVIIPTTSSPSFPKVMALTPV